MTAPADDGWYVVKAGDTLTGIVRTVTVENIMAWNGLTSDVIQPGQRLRLTAPATPPPPPPPPAPKVVLGHYAGHGGGSWRQRVDAIERKFGKFAGHQRYYMGAGSSGVLTAELRAWLDADPRNRLFLNWKPGSSHAGALRMSTGLVTAAKSWAPYVAKGQLKVTLWHEPENDSGLNPATYVAMWRYVAPILKANAPGLQLAWCMMGVFSGHPQSLYEQLWPGADVVDLLAHDPYIVKGAAPSKLPTNMINGAKAMRALPGAANLPVYALEWGADLGGGTTSRGTDQHRADAFDAVRNALPELAEAGHVELDLFDAGTDWLTADGPDVAAYKRLKAATEES